MYHLRQIRLLPLASFMKLTQVMVITKSTQHCVTVEPVVMNIGHGLNMDDYLNLL